MYTKETLAAELNRIQDAFEEECRVNGHTLPNGVRVPETPGQIRDYLGNMGKTLLKGQELLGMQDFSAAVKR